MLHLLAGGPASCWFWVHMGLCKLPARIDNAQQALGISSVSVSCALSHEVGVCLICRPKEPANILGCTWCYASRFPKPTVPSSLALGAFSLVHVFACVLKACLHAALHRLAFINQSGLSS